MTAFLPCYNGIIKFFTKKTKFIGEENLKEGPALIISNHEAAAGPLAWHFFFKHDKKLWATHEMTEGLKAVFRYLAYNYFPRKRHVPGWLSVAIAFVACPFVNLIMKCMDPIPTYSEGSLLLTTFRKSHAAVREGKKIVIFPEDSSEGYSERPNAFLDGVAALGHSLMKKGYDMPVVVSYFDKKSCTVIMREEGIFTELWTKYPDRKLLTEALRQSMLKLEENRKRPPERP
jgi:hypothetical protein